MFSRHNRAAESFSSRYGANKSQRTKKSFNAESFSAGLARSQSLRSPKSNQTSPITGSGSLTSAIITISVGPEQRLFAGHEDILNRSPYFTHLLKAQFYTETSSRRIELPNENAEVLSAVLEFLYKGDYYPKLMHNKKKDTHELEDGGLSEATIVHHLSNAPVLKDTAIYCSADLYGLPELKRLALRKQGLQSGVHVSTILNSARWTYEHTPDDDSALRGHYLTLIVRSRATFKKSSTMRQEMEACGSKLWFDLFVTMCHHLNNLETVRSPYSH